MYKRVLVIAFNSLMVLLAPPSVGIIITWSTLPGELLYPIKRGLESAALFILSPSFQARNSLHSELITRRTSEATKLLAVKNSTQGLKELQAEVEAARLQFEDPNQSATSKQQAAQQMITKLEATQQALNKADQSSTPLPRRTVGNRSTTTTTPQQTATPQTVYVYQNVPETQTQIEIRQTQVIIQKTIVVIQREARSDDRDNEEGKGHDDDKDDNNPSSPQSTPNSDTIPSSDPATKDPETSSPSNETPPPPSEDTSNSSSPTQAP